MSEKSEFRQINMLFNKKDEDRVNTLKDYFGKKQLGTGHKYDLVHHKAFDFNKYSVVSPFA